MVGNKAAYKMNFSIFDIAAVFVCAGISAMGLGGGGVLLIYLSLFKNMPAHEAQGLNLLFFMPVCITSLTVYVKKGMIDYKKILPVLAGSLLGVITGKEFLTHIPPEVLKMIFAVFLITVGAFTLVSTLKKKKLTNN